MISVRPKVAELVYLLYGRSLHPELFDIYQTRTVERNGYKATVRITNAGHLVSWQYGGLILTEVATSSHLELPKTRRLISHRLKGALEDQLDCRGGVHYSASFSLEPTSLQSFLSYQNELTLQATRKGMLHQFESSGRFGAGALSYINIESRDKVFLVQAFHTFPDDCAVLKFQSSFRLP